MWSQLRQAGRQCRQRPGFVITAVGVLALGIGVSAAMFSILDAVLLRPLPYSHPGQLVKIALPQNAGDVDGNLPYPIARELQQRSRDFSTLAFDTGRMITLQHAHSTEMMAQLQVSENLLPTLGTRPAMGRMFTPSDAAAQAPVVVLSDPVWRQLGAPPNILGQNLRLNGKPYTVIGVMPPGFSFPFGNPALWTLYRPAAADRSWKNFNYSLEVVGRLKPGASLARARAELNGIEASIRAAHPGQRLASQVTVEPYRATLVSGYRTALLALSAAVGLVWLIACFSVAGLMLARAAGRQRELALRMALGASWRQIALQLLGEGLWLGAAAGIWGAGLAFALVRGLGHLLRTHLPSGMIVQLNPTVLAGLMAITLLSALLVSVAPALLAVRSPVQAGLHDTARASGGRHTARLRSLLVAGELALALVLLSGGGLLLRTLYALRSVPLGFSTAHIVTTAIMIPQGRFAHENMNQVFDAPLLARLQALPGVTAATLTSVIPLERGFTMTGRFEFANQPNLPPSQQPQGALRITSPNYPKVFGIPVERGRFFNAALDTPTSPTVIVVNHAFAARYFPHRNAVGQAIRIGRHQVATIIGVLADVHAAAIASPPVPEMHFSTSQIGSSVGLFQLAASFTDLAVRSQLPAATIIPEVRHTLHQLAPDLATERFETMRQIVSDSIGNQILAAWLLGIFAAAGLIVALAGLYGLLAYSVAQRTREIGIRMALGAEPSHILGLVLRQAAWLLGVGVAVGLALALAASRLLAAYLYGVPPRDPLTLLAAAVLLASAGLAAAYAPARRAAALSPMTALRFE